MRLSGQDRTKSDQRLLGESDFVSDEAVAEILKDVKAKGSEKRSLITIEEFKEIGGKKTAD